MASKVALIALAHASGVASESPNIVFLLGDDVGWNNVGWHSDIALTPNLDDLANGGIKLNQHYVQRWCAPTRTALLTGRYTYNTGMMHFGHGGSGYEEERTAVPLAFDMLPKLLKSAPSPYKTHMLGKWHLGFFTQNHTPVGRGFDSFFGFFGGQSSHDNRSSQVSHTCKLPVKDLYNSTDIADTSDYYKNNVYNTFMYASEAERIILEHDQSAPLFLYMAFQNCHAPYQAPQSYQDKFPDLKKGKSRICYNAMVNAMDESVGKIVAALKTSGLYSNTVIIWTSDNGGPAKMANNWPLRGAKFTTFQGGLRTAAMLHSPLLPSALAGTESDVLIYVSDWYATIASLAGVDAGRINASGPVPIDGVDVWQALIGDASPPRTQIIHEYDEVQGVYAIRSGPWKLMWGKVSKDGASGWIEDTDYDKKCEHLASPDAYDEIALAGESEIEEAANNGGDITCTEKAPCLFNVIEDPLEKNETAKHEPEVVKRLKQELADYVKNRYTGGLDKARLPQDAYCQWIAEVAWVQPFEDLTPGGPGNCSMELVEQVSSAKCVADGDAPSFGCFDRNNSMWTLYGCRGKFLCNGKPVSCGLDESSASNGKKNKYRVCPCGDVADHLV